MQTLKVKDRSKENNSRLTIWRIATRGNIVAEGRSLLLLNDD